MRSMSILEEMLEMFATTVRAELTLTAIACYTVYMLIIGWNGPEFEFWRGYKLVLSKHPDSHGRKMKLTTYLLAPRLGISGAVPLLPLYIFMAWTGKTFPV